MGRAGIYTEDPMGYLQNFKSKAWEGWEEWKGKTDVSKKYQRLWELQALRASLIQGTCLPKPRFFSPLLEEVIAATIKKHNLKKGRP
jgi:hypothetical protein